MNCPLLHFQLKYQPQEKSNKLFEKFCIWDYTWQEQIFKYLFFIIPNHYHAKLNYDVNKCHVFIN